VSANLLEHVPDDRAALAELRRVLRPGARAAFVVPFGPRTYDYYDRFLGHERRYGRGELAAKARQAGLEVVTTGYLGSLLYPAFWLVKQRNRRLHGQLEGDALEVRVADDIARTRRSRSAQLVAGIDRRLGSLGLTLPFGIRCLTVVRRPQDG
jgi:SAM-dependent methyltransferase